MENKTNIGLSTEETSSVIKLLKSKGAVISVFPDLKTPKSIIVSLNPDYHTQFISVLVEEELGINKKIVNLLEKMTPKERINLEFLSKINYHKEKIKAIELELSELNEDD